MARRSKETPRAGGLTKTVFCPLCQTMMSKSKSKAHQRGFSHRTKQPLINRDGTPVLVTRVFYCCGKCSTVVWFDYREDGKVGELHKETQINKMTGVAPQGLPGRFNEIV